MLYALATIPQADLLVGDLHALVRNWPKALADPAVLYTEVHELPAYRVR
jgi:hypothetical protein